MLYNDILIGHNADYLLISFYCFFMNSMDIKMPHSALEEVKEITLWD